MSKPSKRRSIFVDPKVQSALALRLTLHWLLFAVLITVISTTMTWFSNPFQSFGEVFAQFVDQQWAVLLTMALLLPAFIYDSLKLSNRFAGPIIRFRRTIQAITESGEPRELRFRRGDFWHDLANDFNRMLDRLHPQQHDDSFTVAGEKEEPRHARS